MTITDQKARREAALHASGARCGYGYGRSRVGLYVLGEELAKSHKGAAFLKTPEERLAWAEGYRCGYVLGAEGEALPDSLLNWELPSTSLKG